DRKRILMSIQSDREWQAFCIEFAACPEGGSDERFATNVTRVKNRDATDAFVAEAFSRLDEGQAKAALARADVAFASLNDMAALSRHPHLRRVTVETPGGPVAIPAPAPTMAGAPRHYGPVPALGETRGAMERQNQG